MTCEACAVTLEKELRGVPGVSAVQVDFKNAEAAVVVPKGGEVPSEAIARAVYVSPAHLRRLFQQARGESPQQVFQRMRMEVATDLLAEGRHDLTQAAALIGFSCPSALSRAIKNFFGKSPRALQRG